MHKKTNKKQILFVTIIFLQLVILLGLRNENVGTDTKTYIQMFNIVTTKTSMATAIQTWYESGFAGVSWLISRVWNNSQIYIFIISFVTIFLYFRYIWRNSPNLWMSIYLFVGLQFYYLCFNMMRQALAMAILMNSIELLEKKKYISFFIAVLLACLIHQSSILFLLILILSKIQFNIKTAFITVLCSLIACILITPIIQIIVCISPRYSIYLNSDYFSMGNLVHPLMYLLILIFVSYLIQYKERMDFHINLLLMSTLLAVALYILSIRMNLFVRIAYYFSLPLIVFIPEVLKSTCAIKTWRFFNVTIIIFVFIYNFLILEMGTNGIVPYSFIWS